MNKIRFGILGSGFMGRTHIEAIRRLPNAEVVAVTGGLMDFVGFKKRLVVLPESIITGISGPATGSGSRLSCAKAPMLLRLRKSRMETRGEGKFTEKDGGCISPPHFRQH